jgi:excisionase family DNA binding protein
VDYYTPEEVAQKLKLNINTIWRYIREGKLPASLMGRKYRISEEQLDRFMKSLEVGGEKEDKDKPEN